MKYLRDEMEAYRKEKKEKNEDMSLGEQLQLSFNQVSNRHGTEWTIPLYWALGSSLIFYIIYCICLYGFSLQGNYQKSINLIPYYFEFINPAHKTDFLKKFDIETNNYKDFIALLIDFLSRVTTPILLFQMIQAFRKYGKK